VVEAAYAIIYHHTEEGVPFTSKEQLAIQWASKWWRKNEADLRRRARYAPLLYFFSRPFRQNGYPAAATS
jgi:hypothetical protein